MKLGKEEMVRQADLAALIWICDANVAFTSVDHPMFKRFVSIISKARYSSKSSWTIRDSQLRDEASLVRTYIVTHLQGQ